MLECEEHLVRSNSMKYLFPIGVASLFAGVLFCSISSSTTTNLSSVTTVGTSAKVGRLVSQHLAPSSVMREATLKTREPAAQITPIVEQAASESEIPNDDQRKTWMTAIPLAFAGVIAALYQGAQNWQSPLKDSASEVLLESVVLGATSTPQKTKTEGQFSAEQNLVILQETAARAKIVAEQRGFWNFFTEMIQSKEAMVAAAAAAVPAMFPAAAFASGGAVPTSVTPDLLAGVGAGVSMVAFGQYLYGKAGDHAHGPPEAEHPIDPASQPFPRGEDGEALKMVFSEPFDIWRQSLLRYLGYSNELGEAFRPLVGDFLANSTYAVAVAYVLADSVDKAARASERARELAAAAVFLQIDEGLRGRLKKADFQAALKDVKAPLSAAEVKKFLNRADVRKDKYIDFDEFYLALKRRDPALIQLLEAGAANLPEEQARPWRRALVDGVNLTEVRSAVAGLDALLWQLTASVAMPGFTINRIVALTGAICYGWKVALAGAVDPAALQILNFIPTIVGLLSITVIVHPLDTLADELFNVSIRKYIFQKMPVDQAGQLTEDMMIEKLNKRGGQPVPDEWVRNLFKEVDTDKDGFVSLTEWRRNGIGAYERYVDSLKARR